MEAKRKTMITRFAAAAAGLTAAMFVGMMFPDSEKPSEKPAVTASAGTNAVTVSAEKSVETKNAPAEKKLEFIEYRKADISEYRMAAVSKVPIAVKSSAKKKDESKAGDDEKKKEEKTEEPLNIEDFSVVLPEDGTEVYNIKTEPLNFTDTRSVADEYYTVHDLITGGKVTMNAHTILCMMVYNEIGDQWCDDVIKAHIVAAYTHLRYSEMMGFTPTIALKPGYPDRIENLVMKVEGQCILYNGEMINSVYSASTAGFSADSGEIFGISYPYLKPVVSEYDDQDPNWGSVMTISEEDVRKAIESKYGITLSDDCSNWFSVDYMHAGRYVGSITVDDGKATISGAQMRTLLKLKSSAFEISYSGGVFTFKTYGYGHGVGMSQWGAKLYADAGWTYDQILRHYFVNTTLGLSSVSRTAVQRGLNPPPQETDYTPDEQEPAEYIIDYYEDQPSDGGQTAEVKDPEPEPQPDPEPEPEQQPAQESQPEPEPEPSQEPAPSEEESPADEQAEQSEAAEDTALE